MWRSSGPGRNHCAVRRSREHELVAQAYRRRAAELELEVWLTQLRAGHLVGPVAA